MSGNNHGRSPVIHFVSSVGPERADNVSIQHRRLYPHLPTESLDMIQPHSDSPPRSQMSATAQRTPQVSALSILNLSLPNIRTPEMMDLSMYVPTMNPPPFMKDVQNFPSTVGAHVTREVQHLEKNINRLIDRSEVFLHKPPPLPEFTNWSIFSTLLSIAGFFFDHGSDIATAYVLYNEANSKWWFWLTVILIVVPTVFINAFSLYWYFKKDYKTTREMFSSRPELSHCWWVLRIVVHIILLGPLFRYFDLLYYGLLSRKSKVQRVNVQGPYCPWPKKQAELKKQVDYYNLLLREERDLSILELMHSFMQDAPQLILQIYILAKRPVESKSQTDYIITVMVQVFSSFTSLLSLAWSLTSYQRTLRYASPEKPQMSVGGSATTFLWHAFQVTSRVLALALFANVYRQEVFLLLGGHWALMTAWILAQRTNFCGTKDGQRKPFEEFFYNVVVGWMSVFVMINVKSAATRIKYTVFYVLMAIENAILITLWYISPDSIYRWYHLPGLISTCVCFVLGLFFMFLYYRHYHPDGKMPRKNETPKLF